MKIHILGDSLVQTRQARTGKFYCGWGDALSWFFDPETELLNYALGGRSSRSFLNEGRFFDNGLFTADQVPRGMGPALPRIEKGDYVLIQFMDNDDDSASCAYRVNKHVDLGKPDANGIYPTVLPEPSMISSTENWRDGYKEELESEGKSAAEIEAIMNTTEELIGLCGGKFYSFDCGATYKGYLAYYITAAREKGATPILVVSGAKFPMPDGKIQPAKGYRGGSDAYHDFTYVEAMRQVGREYDVPVVDLFAAEKELYEALGEEKAKYFHNLGIEANDIQDIDATDPFGPGVDISDWVSDLERRWEEKDFKSFDGTHKNHFGAFIDGAFIADILYEKNILREHISLKPSAFPGMPAPLASVKAQMQSFFKHVRLFTHVNE